MLHISTTHGYALFTISSQVPHDMPPSDVTTSEQWLPGTANYSSPNSSVTHTILAMMGLPADRLALHCRLMASCNM